MTRSDLVQEDGRVGEERCDVLVIGAGLAGLSAACHLQGAGCTRYRVIEAEGRPGGWAKTDWSGPWGADRAIHVLYFRSPEMRRWVGELLGGRWRQHVKHCVVDSGGVRTPFPFHANLHGRPADVVLECLEGLWQASLAQARAQSPPVTFADWIARTSGAGVARHFMDPYNTKMWTVPPHEMGWEWMGDFIPTLEPGRILAGALAPADSNVGLNATFHYAHRGASDLAEALASRIRPIRFNTRVVAIDAPARVARLDDGTRIRYEEMVSTMPLRTLAAMLEPLPEPEQRAAKRLEAIDLVLVDVGFENPEIFDVHWAYLPDPDVLAYRLHAVHSLSPEMMPSGCGLYCLEISHSSHRPLPRGDLRPRIVDDLVRTGWLRSADQVRFYRERRFPCSYVLPRVGFQRDAERVRAYAGKLGIHSIGRYGEWKYCNQEDALADGKRTAERLLKVSLQSS